MFKTIFKKSNWAIKNNKDNSHSSIAQLMNLQINLKNFYLIL